MSGIEIVGIALAIPPTIEICIKYGKRLIEACEAYSNAAQEIKERALRIRACLLRVNSQLECLGSLTSVLPEEHLDIQRQTVEVLISKLKIANSKLESVFKFDSAATVDGAQVLSGQGSIRRRKYVLRKESLDKVIDELEKWQQIFDPSWYLIIRSATEQVDTQLAKTLKGSSWSRASSATLCSAQSIRAAVKNDNTSAGAVFLQEAGLGDAEKSTIPFSSMTLAVKTGSGGSRTYILDSVHCPTHANPAVLARDVRNLARKLSHADPLSFNLMNCKGVLKQPGWTRGEDAFTFVFRKPDGFDQPKSLRSSLLGGDKSHSLSDRFKLASQIATSVSYVHAFGFVHKDIRPETILVLSDGRDSIGSAFLAGFAHIRAAEGMSSRQQPGGSVWTSKLYHHPRRIGEVARDMYIMQHDIYSLGVCLLEIGLWTSLVLHENEQMVPSQTLGLHIQDFFEPYEPESIKDHLVSIARKQLPRVMGTRYTEVVQTCLTCLDEGNSDFGDEEEFQDEDGILVGVRYIEKVLMQLNSLCV